MTDIKKEEIKQYLLSLQNNICSDLERVSGDKFETDSWSQNGINGISRVVTGDVLEKGGVNFSHVKGAKLPKSATNLRSELSGASFEAMGVSLVIHPRNPFVPTTHMNVRYIEATPEEGEPVWWFGGGFDLTPYYPFIEDCKHWHKVAKDFCFPFGESVYKKYKQECDEYFFLKHRGETRGIGGLFFDDLNMWEKDVCFRFIRSVGDGFIDAYSPILARRKDLPFGSIERDFQSYRRGRYVEFNLVYDRGTLFGLQSNGRAESILMSMPPTASWEYCYTPKENSRESELYKVLKPIDWLAMEEEAVLQV